LFENLEYENIWMDDRQEFGFQMTSKTREEVLNALEEALRTSAFKINSERTVSELNTFIITENGKIEADKTYHDDLVMSLALAAKVYKNLQINLPSEMGKSKENETKPELDPYQWVSTNGDKEDTSWILKD
jgi:hypothetical protein